MNTMNKASTTHYWNQPTKLTTKPPPFFVHNHQQLAIKSISNNPKDLEYPKEKQTEKHINHQISKPQNFKTKPENST